MYLTNSWENRWQKTFIERAEAERQLARIALLQMDQLPIPIEQFNQREESHGFTT